MVAPHRAPALPTAQLPLEPAPSTGEAPQAAEPQPQPDGSEAALETSGPSTAARASSGAGSMQAAKLRGGPKPKAPPPPLVPAVARSGRTIKPPELYQVEIGTALSKRDC